LLNVIEYMHQVLKSIKPIVGGRVDKAKEKAAGLSAIGTSCKHPVLSTDGEGSYFILHSVVINFEHTV